MKAEKGKGRKKISAKKVPRPRADPEGTRSSRRAPKRWEFVQMGKRRISDILRRRGNHKRALVGPYEAPLKGGKCHSNGKPRRIVNACMPSVLKGENTKRRRSGEKGRNFLNKTLHRFIESEGERKTQKRSI